MSGDVIIKFYLVDQMEMEETMRIIQRMTSDIVELTYVIESLANKVEEMEKRIDILESKKDRDDKGGMSEMA